MSQSLPLSDGGRRRASPGRAGSRILALFSLPFCAVGVYMAVTLFTALGRGEPFDQEAALRGVIAVTFGIAGFGLLAYARWAGGRSDEIAALRRRHPDEPWRWRPEWAHGRVPAQDGATAVVSCLFAVVWNSMSAPLLWVVPRELEGGNAAAAFGLLFPVVGAGLAVWTVRATWRRRRFGRCVFALDTLPGVIGGPLRGTLHVPAAADLHRGLGLRHSEVEVEALRERLETRKQP